MRYQLIIAYDGTHYAGWQVQKNGQAIQPLIQKALQTILRHDLDLTGSSRTDAGVHARGQSAHFDTNVPFELKKLLLSVNALLPLDIRVLRIQPVAPDFHARYSAKSKIYSYYLHLGSISDPFTNLYAHQVFGSFDLEWLKRGALYFLGTHDFRSFANAGNEKEGTRTIYRIDAFEQEGKVRLEFEGNGFLYKMVRNMTGMLLDVAARRIAPEEIEKILASRDRQKAAATAPAKGLFLNEILYPKDARK